MGCGKKESQPTIPSYSRAEIPADLLSYIKSGVGRTLPEPSEYGISSQALQDLLGYMPQLQQLTEPAEYGRAGLGLEELLGYTPDQFQYPMNEIQQALAAQQALQMEQYQKQLRPVMAQQGQLDSTYYANMISDYLKGQQAQTYGTTADLLTNQAMQNYDLSKWLPQFKSGILGEMGNLGQLRQGTQQYNVDLANQLATWLPGFRSGVAGQLAGIGGQRADIGQLNLNYPYQTYIPAYQQAYGTSVNEGNLQYQSAMNQYNAAMQEYEQKQAERAAKSELISRFAGPIAGGWYGESAGVGLAPAMQGTLKNVELLTGLGRMGNNIDLSSLLGNMNFSTPSAQYKPQWASFGGKSPTTRYRPTYDYIPTNWYQ